MHSQKFRHQFTQLEISKRVQKFSFDEDKVSWFLLASLYVCVVAGVLQGDQCDKLNLCAAPRPNTMHLAIK